MLLCPTSLIGRAFNSNTGTVVRASNRPAAVPAKYFLQAKEPLHHNARRNLLEKRAEFRSFLLKTAINAGFVNDMDLGFRLCYLKI